MNSISLAAVRSNARVPGALLEPQQSRVNTGQPSSSSSGNIGLAEAMAVVFAALAGFQQMLQKMSEKQATSIASQYREAKQMLDDSCKAADERYHATFVTSLTQGVGGVVSMVAAMPGLGGAVAGADALITVGQLGASAVGAASSGATGFAELGTAGLTADAAKLQANVDTVESNEMKQYHQMADQARDLVQQSVQQCMDISSMLPKLVEAFQPVTVR